MTLSTPFLEIDEARRELRAGGKARVLQPKVFDLLVYLAHHRDRVVPKRELLEAVWPDVVVTDASLQRAISLARAALVELGVPETIRTYARQGYRFCSDHLDEASSGETNPDLEVAPRKPDLRGASHPVDDAPASEVPGALRAAREAYARGEWEVAVTAFQQLDTDERGLGADDLQRWAHAAQCMGEPQQAFPALERAVAAYAVRGSRRHAAWAAILCAHLRVEWGEYPVANGWVQRAERLLDGLPTAREHGYLALLRARLALLHNRLEEALEQGSLAYQTGRAVGDPDLEGLGLVHRGEAQLYLGQIEDGLNALDEAGVSVVANGLSAWAGGLVYCGVIFGCMTRADWQRATQWTEQFTRWCTSHGAGAYPGLCRLHRAEVLTVKGELAEAEAEIRGTIATLAAHAPWAEGDAHRALGDIHLARGDYAEAREAYVRAAELGWDTALSLAIARHYDGDAEGAMRQLARSIESGDWSCRAKRGLALAHLVMAAAAAGDLDRAQRALQELRDTPLLTTTPPLQAWHTRVTAQLLLARGDRVGALGMLNEAWCLWQKTGAPLPAAEIRQLRAELLLAEGDPDAAEADLRAATHVFQQAGAEGKLKQCQALAALVAQSRATPIAG